MCPQTDSNSHLELRRFLFYPLNYGDRTSPQYMQKTDLTTWVDKILILLMGFFVLMWPLSLKKIVFIQEVQGQLNEFASIAVYGTYIIALAFIMIFIAKYNKILLLSIVNTAQRTWSAANVPRGTFAIILLAAILWSVYSMNLLYGIDFAKKVLIAVAFVCAYLYMQEILPKIVPRGTIRRRMMYLLSVVGVYNAVIAIAQFIRQESVGLSILRESNIGSDIAGTAKIYIFGEVLVRGYGLLPHPNILAGVLMLTITATYIMYRYFITANVPRGTLAVIKGVLIVQICGLIVTFSRSAFIAGGSVLFCALIYKKSLKKSQLFHVEQLLKYRKWLVLMIAGVGAFMLVYISNSVQCEDMWQKSLCERIIYMDAAKNMIKENPVKGLGDFMVLHIQEKVDKTLSVWQFQPVHNTMMLVYVETGMGWVVLIGVIGIYFISIVPRGTIDRKLWGAVFIMYGIISTIDHYFWDIQQGIIALMFCVFLIKYSKKNKT